MKTKKHLLRVFFYPVKTAKEKLNTLIKIAESHIEKESKLAILTASSESAAYIDKLLWSHSPLSFIPHSMNEEAHPLILIAHSLLSCENYPNILNLTEKPILEAHSHLKNIYELEDLTSSAKMELAKMKYETYKTENYHLLNLTVS